MRVAIVGAGFGGLAAATALQRAGMTDFRIYERAEDVGGVWHHNTYPGVACDVPSYLYSFSYEQRSDWSRPCSPGNEIQAYLKDTVAKYGLEDRIQLSTEITSAEWDEDAGRWTLETDAGNSAEFDALVLASGQLSRPGWPDIEGMEDFAGHAFHSAEWDHDHDLRGRRVAVIGTGASAIQFIPAVAEQAGHLDLYQRTAPYLLPRRNPRYPRALRRLFARVPALRRLRRDGLTAFMELMLLGLTQRLPSFNSLLYTWSRVFMRMQLSDPEVRRKVWPTETFGCKRILFSSSYLPALQRRNVTVVTDGIERITAGGVLTEDGQERPADTIIWGTGFRANDFVVPMQVRGRGGRDLQERWADGADAHLGITVSEFPNLFLMYGPNTNLGGGSIIVMLEAQAAYIVEALRHAARRGTAVEVRREVQDRSGERIQQALEGSVWTSCASWYRDESSGRIVNNWPGMMREYAETVRHFDPGEYEELTRRDAAPAGR